jgi:pilus assembly protein CpaB
MRAKPIVITVFALSTGVGAFALLNASMQKGTAAIPKEQILAASSELSVGTLLRAQDITWQPVVTTQADQIKRPAASVVDAKPEIVDETAATVYGAVLRHKLAPGDPIRRGDIVKPGDRDFLQVVLLPGQRAISIPVATGGASTGLLSPGDRVDVILTQNFKNDTNKEVKETPLTRRSVGETIARNLRVLAIDAPDAKRTTGGATPAPARTPSVAPATPTTGAFGRTVTLEVTPEQAEDINVAIELGKLSLTLRNIASANLSEPIKPRWAGDVSPALYDAPQAKPIALTPKQVLVLRGGDEKEKDRRREVIKFDDGNK